MKINYSKHIVLGNGKFPTHAIPLEILQKAETIICCDGAVDSLLKFGLEPTLIIGDMDSINKDTKIQLAHKIIHDENQEKNDQTKAIEWAISQGITDIVILGATGFREDHTIGNISLLTKYAKQIKVCMASNYGIFTPICNSTSFTSFKTQQVSIFCVTPQTKITSQGLKFPLQNLQLNSWWMGTLNESLGDSFNLEFDNGEVIVFQEFEKLS